MAVASRLKIEYDAGEDILSIRFARPQNDAAIEVDDDVFVHINPRTKRVVSVTVLNFRRRFTQGNVSQVLPVVGDLLPDAALRHALPA